MKIKKEVKPQSPIVLWGPGERHRPFGSLVYYLSLFLHSWPSGAGWGIHGTVPILWWFQDI